MKCLHLLSILCIEITFPSLFIWSQKLKHVNYAMEKYITAHMLSKENVCLSLQVSHKKLRACFCQIINIYLHILLTQQCLFERSGSFQLICGSPDY